MHVQAYLKIMHVQSSQQIFQSADLLKGCPRATKVMNLQSSKMHVQAIQKVVHVQASKKGCAGAGLSQGGTRAGF